MFRITFNHETSRYAFTDLEKNLKYVKTFEKYTNDLFRVRGYLYINDIYEDLGVEWNPEWKNLCRIYEEGARIDFKIAKQNRSTGEIILDID